MTSKEQVSIKDLRGVDIFTGLSEHALEEIARNCSQRTYKTGERCAVQGELADELGIVNDGKVAIEMRIEVAPYTQTVSLYTLTRGNMFGWSALVEPHTFTASARCIGEVRAIYIKATNLQRLFKEMPSVEHVMMKNLATIMSLRLRDSYTQLTHLVAEMIKQGR